MVPDRICKSLVEAACLKSNDKRRKSLWAIIVRLANKPIKTWKKINKICCCCYSCTLYPFKWVLLLLNHLIFITVDTFFSLVKFSFSEKAIKIWKNIPLVLRLLSKNNCFAKTGGRFFQILWPSHNIWTVYTSGFGSSLKSTVF